ncbi:MAG: MscL family protein, partial [Clostridia bacterium]|nr:MscL family protein [Clostridia bacterium]
MKKFFKEFKDFITRGNVLDMAVGVIVGGAFTAIITALTGQILQPLINW